MQTRPRSLLSIAMNVLIRTDLSCARHEDPIQAPPCQGPMAARSALNDRHALVLCMNSHVCRQENFGPELNRKLEMAEAAMAARSAGRAWRLPSRRSGQVAARGLSTFGRQGPGVGREGALGFL